MPNTWPTSTFRWLRILILLGLSMFVVGLIDHAFQLRAPFRVLLWLVPIAVVILAPFRNYYRLVKTQRSGYRWLTCPVCQYNLRGSTHICPECGTPIPVGEMPLRGPADSSGPPTIPSDKSG